MTAATEALTRYTRPPSLQRLTRGVPNLSR